MSGVTTGSLTYAARNSNFDGQDIREGDHMAMVNDKLLYTNKNAKQVYRRLAEELAKTSPSFVTVFIGEGVSEADAEAMSELLQEHCGGAEISLVEGGQPVYSFILSAE